MDKSRTDIKVGLFVLVGLVLIAGGMVWFSKGTSIFRGTYELKLRAVNVGGIKQRAVVLLAGAQVGSASQVRLADDGRRPDRCTKQGRGGQRKPDGPGPGQRGVEVVHGKIGRAHV